MRNVTKRNVPVPSAPMSYFNFRLICEDQVKTSLRKQNELNPSSEITGSIRGCLCPRLPLEKYKFRKSKETNGTNISPHNSVSNLIINLLKLKEKQTTM